MVRSRADGPMARFCLSGKLLLCPLWRAAIAVERRMLGSTRHIVTRGDNLDEQINKVW